MTLALRDPFSDVLTLLRPEAVLAAEVRARGRWSLAFDGRPALKFGVVVAGHCLISVSRRAPTTLRAGDVFLVAGSSPFVMASDLRKRSQSARALLSRATGRVVQIGAAGAKPSVHIVGGHFVLSPVNAHLLVDALPSLMCVPFDEASPLRDLMPLLVDEVRSLQPGRQRALDQLAQLALTYMLRRVDVATDRAVPTGWLQALADARIGAALRHIHDNLQTGTSLPELARVAGMSRTAFAARFKRLVGRPPLAYVIQWRMALAKHALRTRDGAIGALAFELGYASESAFSMAFRRVVGCSPRAYREANDELSAVPST